MSLQTRLAALISAIGADIKDLQAKAGAAVTISQEGWHYVGAAGEPAFQNSFINQGGTTVAARFRKDPAGRVYVEADVQSTAGVANDELTVFTLPVGYRPDVRNYDIELIASGAAGGYAYIDTNGNVVAHRGATVATGIFIRANFWTGQLTFPATLAAVQQEGWHIIGAAGEPAFSASHTAGSDTPGFRKDPAGMVHMKGFINTPSDAANGVMFTLPVGYRPPATRRFACIAPGAVVRQVDVNPDGTFMLYARNGWVDLSTIEFDTGQTIFPASVVAVAQETWHLINGAGEPAFQNNWVNSAGVFNTVAFKKTPDGRIRLRGMIKNGTLGSVMFTLPVGYRPPATLVYMTTANGSVAEVRIAADGTVTHNASQNQYVSLDGIEFDLGQLTFPAGKSVIPVVTALPTGATDGDEIYFQSAAMAIDGVVWHLRFNAASASAYKWEYIGGGPIYKAGTTTDWNARSTANSSANAFIDSTAPQITTPLAGDYEAEGNATCVSTNPTGSPGISLEKAGVTPAWNTGDSLWSVSAGSSLNTIPVNAYKRILGQTAGANIIMWYLNANVAGAVSFYNARMRVKPIRVG